MRYDLANPGGGISARHTGLPVMAASLVLQLYGVSWMGPVVAGSSTVVLLSLLVFTINLCRNGRLGAATAAG